MRTPAITFSTGSLYLYSLDRCFALAAAYGFDGVEVLVDERFDTRQPDNLQRLADTYRIPITSLHAPFYRFRLPGWNSGPVGAIKHTVALAEELGAAHVVIHLPERLGPLFVEHGPRRVMLPWLPLSKAVKDWMAGGGLARFQAETEVKICVENLPRKGGRLERLLGPEGLFWWNTLEQWPQTHAYLTLDTTHWGTHGIDPLTAYRAGGTRIRHIHLSNFRHGMEHQLPHRGDLNLGALLRQLVADDFDGQIVLELDQQSLEAGDEASVRRNLAASMAFCKEALAAAH